MGAALSQLGERMRERGSGKGVYLQAIARALQPLQRPGARKAFLQTLRSVIDTQGQRVSARDRLYLLGPIPTLIVWGGRDHTIPVSHGRRAHEAIPDSRFELLPRAAHFPHLEDPEGPRRGAVGLPRDHRAGPDRRPGLGPADRPAFAANARLAEQAGLADAYGAAASPP